MMSIASKARAGALLAIVALIGAATGKATAQCLLANPSFELPVGDPTRFAGWNAFGPVSADSVASHGARAVRVQGPATGRWDVAAVWQPVSCAPGDVWDARVRVRHDDAMPVLGEARALLNLEWRDAQGVLISYETHTVLDANAPRGRWVDAAVVSGPAPAGVATVRLLLGVLQGPTDPTPAVRFDESGLDLRTDPTIDEIQWADFPGGRRLDFAGRTWRVKGPGVYGPGPNEFCDDPACTWVDATGALHLTLQRIDGVWRSTEVTVEDVLGYGDYVLTTRSDLGALEPNVVCGLFLWQYTRCYEPDERWWNPNDEIDIEYGRWGDPSASIGQFVAQPYDYPGNLFRFDLDTTGGVRTTHAMRWLADRVEYRVWRGGPDDESEATTVASWTYAGPHVPLPDRARLHLNLWWFAVPPTTDHEVVFEGFVHRPTEPPTAAAAGATRVPRRLRAATPNPFNALTRIRFVLDRDETVRIDVFDVAGRHVRTLVEGFHPRGTHETTWNGTDAAGRPVASGVYVYRLATPSAVETRRMVLVE